MPSSGPSKTTYILLTLTQIMNNFSTITLTSNFFTIITHTGQLKVETVWKANWVKLLEHLATKKNFLHYAARRKSCVHSLTLKFHLIRPVCKVVSFVDRHTRFNHLWSPKNFVFGCYNQCRKGCTTVELYDFYPILLWRDLEELQTNPMLVNFSSKFSEIISLYGKTVAQLL